MDYSTTNEDKFTILKDYIEVQLKNKTLDLDPSPSPNCRELKNAYDEVVTLDNDYTIIKSAWPIENYVPYVIYMVKLDQKYWIVPLPHKCSTAIYSINEYVPDTEED